MVTYRRLAIVVVVALVVIAALPNPTGLRVAAVGAVALLAAGYAMWLANRGEWTRHERPAAAPDARVAEIISAPSRRADACGGAVRAAHPARPA